MGNSSTSPLLPITNVANGASNAIAAADSRLYIFRLRNETIIISLAVASTIACVFSITGNAPWQTKDGKAISPWYEIFMGLIVISFFISYGIITVWLAKKGFYICGCGNGRLGGQEESVETAVDETAARTSNTVEVIKKSESSSGDDNEQ